MTTKQRAYLKKSCHDHGSDLSDWKIQHDSKPYTGDQRGFGCT